MANLIEKTCKDCGCTFLVHPRGHRAERCEDCREEHIRIRDQRNRLKREQKKRARMYPGPAKTIHEILRECRIYNQEHGTNLTYGQYVMKVEGVRTNGKKKR